MGSSKLFGFVMEGGKTMGVGLRSKLFSIFPDDTEVLLITVSYDREQGYR